VGTVTCLGPTLCRVEALELCKLRVRRICNPTSATFHNHIRCTRGANILYIHDTPIRVSTVVSQVLESARIVCLWVGCQVRGACRTASFLRNPLTALDERSHVYIGCGVMTFAYVSRYPLLNLSSVVVRFMFGACRAPFRDTAE
jgi:hypothetical protein